MAGYGRQARITIKIFHRRGTCLDGSVSHTGDGIPVGWPMALGPLCTACGLGVVRADNDAPHAAPAVEWTVDPRSMPGNGRASATASTGSTTPSSEVPVRAQRWASSGAQQLLHGADDFLGDRRVTARSVGPRCPSGRRGTWRSSIGSSGSVRLPESERATRRICGECRADRCANGREPDHYGTAARGRSGFHQRRPWLSRASPSHPSTGNPNAQRTRREKP